MCLFSKPSQPDPPALPPEPAQLKQPDGAAVRTAVARRTEDRVRSRPDTILTSPGGVTTTAPTEKKTLLGQ
ncbi:hypothetical protein CO670_17155 [Rhizobium sp. J15]|uniref:hypothetical protein n=1 Tax=unclassified Rhizobium TaxID=2613769 RepID=UPI000B533B49|nr:MULTISPECIES: hypothetical protein [unclassified Rhizobium]OWV77625.1 hypothetical protein ATY77_30095 [Rhizobium sp. R634]PDT15504.1 hypothetical protein CO670_17155 [Rhizobium sp. J15]